MRAPRLHTETRRDQIAQAVLALAAEQGAASLSVAAVAERVGVAPSALYRHYPSKHAMLAATIDRLGTRMVANVARARAESDDALGALERLLMLQVRLVVENRGIPFVMFSEPVQRDVGHRRQMMLVIVRFRRALAGLIREAQRDGRIRPDLDPGALAVHFIGLYVPPAILWNVTRGRFDITAQARRAWAVFHAGIRPSRAPRARSRRPRPVRRQERTA